MKPVGTLELRELVEQPEPLEPIRYPKEIELRSRISRGLVEEIPRSKKEPEWMLRLRLRALEVFDKLPMPKGVYGIEYIDLDELTYYIKPEAKRARSWEELPLI